ncbi:alkylglycerol monooxygenase-like isoform X2 [Dreissena polymorpha]|uniref:alkylglycerol monooxygenase-like isoform X2 n=1 Tax=Dreissena polymorpha TaxID=45954 RepID=UPI0022645910|nr:alkylglycerol monooxygenase-like isoform X2 [Dreissena polymorpha]
MSNFNKVDFVTGMRRMVYAVTPNETYFERFEDVPHYINEATPFFWVCMIIEILISVAKQDRKYRLNDSFTSISAGMFSRLPMIILRSITLEGYVWVYRNWRLTELPWDSPWTWWLTFLGVDMGYYWFHRMAHEVNFMWAFHQTHHSSEDYNLSTALRQSALQMYTSWVFYLPLALFIPPSVFLVHQELNILYQFWIHTQYIRSLGPLEYILNTPSHHRVHHGRNPYCIDKNYAGTLIIWDRMFGTFVQEGDEVAYGLTHPINTFEPFAVQFDYTRYLLGRMFGLPGVVNKIKNFLYGPGWLPGKPRTGDIEDIPQIENPVQRYHVTLPSWLSVYVFVHFFVYAFGYQELMARKTNNAVTVNNRGRKITYLKSAKLFELLRCALFLAGETVMYKSGWYGDKSERPIFVEGLRAFYALSCALWIPIILKSWLPQGKALLNSSVGGKKYL